MDKLTHSLEVRRRKQATAKAKCGFFDPLRMDKPKKNISLKPTKT
jgi:hypothetical protein